MQNRQLRLHHDRKLNMSDLGHCGKVGVEHSNSKTFFTRLERETDRQTDRQTDRETELTP